MRVEAHNKLSAPAALEATRVLIRNQFGDPVAVVLEPFEGRIDVLKSGDDGFAEEAARLGAFEIRPAAATRLPEAPRVVV